MVLLCFLVLRILNNLPPNVLEALRILRSSNGSYSSFLLPSSPFFGPSMLPSPQNPQQPPSARPQSPTHPILPSSCSLPHRFHHLVLLLFFRPPLLLTVFNILPSSLLYSGHLRILLFLFLRPAFLLIVISILRSCNASYSFLRCALVLIALKTFLFSSLLFPSSVLPSSSSSSSSSDLY